RSGLRSAPAVLQSSAPARALHSFPTRRSSDLIAGGQDRRSQPARRPRRYAGRFFRQACSTSATVITAYATNTRKYSPIWASPARSEEHTSELQSRGHLVCRLLLEKKKTRPQRD